MKPLVKLCFVIFTLSFLTSCSAGKMSYRKMETIRKGMTPAQFAEATSVKKAQYIFDFTVSDVLYKVYVYKLGIRTLAFNDLKNDLSGLVATSNSTTAQVSYNQFFTPPAMNMGTPGPGVDFNNGPDMDFYSSGYGFIYKDNKLLYWGYLEELTKHPDHVISELGDKTEKEYARRLKMLNNKNFKG